jgi:hypothetical protein
LQGIQYKFQAFELDDAANFYNIKIGDLKVVGVNGTMSDIIAPECIIFHLNNSATFLRSCNFLNPDFFLNSTTLYHLNKDLILNQFEQNMEPVANVDNSSMGS